MDVIELEDGWYVFSAFGHGGALFWGSYQECVDFKKKNEAQYVKDSLGI